MAVLPNEDCTAAYINVQPWDSQCEQYTAKDLTKQKGPGVSVSFEELRVQLKFFSNVHHLLGEVFGIYGT